RSKTSTADRCSSASATARRGSSRPICDAARPGPRRLPVIACSGLGQRRAAMKGNDDVVAMLNKVLYNELTAINQYFLHSRMLRNWGVTKLAKYEYEQSLDEMRHADKLIERILLLEGLPHLQDPGKLLIGEDVEEILKCDLRLEQIAIPVLKEGIALCDRANDYVSRRLIEEILVSEEVHVDTLEAQFELIKRVGLQNYVQLQSE